MCRQGLGQQRDKNKIEIESDWAGIVAKNLVLVLIMVILVIWSFMIWMFARYIPPPHEIVLAISLLHLLCGNVPAG